MVVIVRRLHKCQAAASCRRFARKEGKKPCVTDLVCNYADDKPLFTDNCFDFSQAQATDSCFQTQCAAHTSTQSTDLLVEVLPVVLRHESEE